MTCSIHQNQNLYHPAFSLPTNGGIASIAGLPEIKSFWHDWSTTKKDIDYWILEVGRDCQATFGGQALPLFFSFFEKKRN